VSTTRDLASIWKWGAKAAGVLVAAGVAAFVKST
jgi:hypothetical protein